MTYSKLYWIGIRESEIRDINGLFEGSITIFGSGQNNNFAFEKVYKTRINYNKDNEDLNCFIAETAKKLVESDPEIKFLLYYPMEAEGFGNIVLNHSLCLNSLQLTNLLENKLYTKLWMSDLVPIIPFSTVVEKELNYQELCSRFKESNTFVIQGTFSCGGSSTWMVDNEQDFLDVQKQFIPYDIYTVSPYIKDNISVNIHMIIYEEDIVIFPSSIQLICIEHHSLCYKGADFVMASMLPEETKIKINEYSKKIGTKLQVSGYRGVCGIDFLITENDIFFVEINARFQSSSFLINEALAKLNRPSLQEMNIEAFIQKKCTYTVSDLVVQSSFYSFSYSVLNLFKMQYIWQIASNCPEVKSLIDDNIDWNITMEESTYLYKLVFNTNITCITSQQSYRIYNVFDFNFDYDFDKPWYEQLIQLKILLLNKGIHIDKRALKQLSFEGGPNYETFYAIDLSIENRLYVNVPYQVKFSELSSFDITLKGNSYVLKCYNKEIATIYVRTVDPLAAHHTKTGIPYNLIAYMGVDRLRIHQRGGCYFKDNNIGCRFCDVENEYICYTIDDIKEVIDAYLVNPNLNHFLIGGGSIDYGLNFKVLLQTANYIKKKADKKIYIMTIPPSDTHMLEQLKESGVTEVAFNLEVFDRTIAKQIMPGKGCISLECYEKAFKKAVELWGETGNVRSALIVGLESVESLLNGVEYLCKLGVSPILSLFKPAADMEDFLAPSNLELYNIWKQTESICNYYNVPLGPACHFCEDNVIKVTLDNNRE